MTKRQDLIGEEKYQQAMASLKQPNDSLMVTRWMINFVKMD